VAGERAASKNQADARLEAETALSLKERVKELSCLYFINQIFETFGDSPDEVFQQIVELIPPAWQYPDIASARIVLDGRRYETPGFREGRQRQSADVILGGKSRGSVEVVYAEEKLPHNVSPFLKEEQNLLDAIARQIAFIVERQQAEQGRAQLQKQLMHAERLATIGQLAAGVAHELNEPLSSILGFAQLAQRDPGLPEDTVHDIQRIVTASLHAREVIKKLLLFARQTPTFKGHAYLNNIVSEALGLFEHRFKNEGIELVCTLCPRMPEITADAGQLTQVLVNLVVNAIQAMPAGGKLNVLTDVQDRYVVCIVEDTGVGMTEEVLDRLFVPFFTTKEVNQGTGLGLPVVHGIVTSHGGTIEVKSEPGKGTKFTIRLPIEPGTNQEDRPES
jgi:two-component system NtrC family sensor kinase